VVEVEEVVVQLGMLVVEVVQEVIEKTKLPLILTQRLL
jgi:hypothetical protein